MFFHFFWLLLFLFLFLCFFFCSCFCFAFFFLLCSLDAISSKFFYVFIESSEEDDEAIEAMVEIDKFEDSLKQKEIIKPE